jgi:purine-nucleoside phosphorylase
MNYENVRQSADFIRQKLDSGTFPNHAVILGSGLGNFINTLEDRREIPMEDIPWYPRPTISGHEGRIVVGKIRTNLKDGRDRDVCLFQGRIHFYECGNVETVLYPIFVMNELGIENLLITNAAGGINKEFKPGDLMLIRDQINLTFKRPFPEYSEYTRQRITPVDMFNNEKCECIELVALLLGISMVQGIYGGLLGPSYETPSEIHMLDYLGADAVGMSTVLEVLQANLFGMSVSGISCITNYATGISDEKLSHDDVKVTAAKVNTTFTSLLRGILTHPSSD